MGFYIRKAISVGPFRFNLSKSGIGISVGIKGLRIGSGPRGTYIHMGRGGLYYRKTLPTNSTKAQPTANIPCTPGDYQEAISVTHDPLQEIESGDTTLLVDSSSQELINEINAKKKKLRFWPAVAVAGSVGCFLVVYNALPDRLLYLALAVSVFAVAVARYYDLMSKTVVLIYDIEHEFHGTYERLFAAFESMAKCNRQWHLEAEGAVRNKKYHAGADSLVRRTSISIAMKAPPYIKTNVSTPCISVGLQTLYFFPDRVLVYSAKAVGAVSYENLSVQVESSPFIERAGVPKDAKVIEHTWEYVNKHGGPDKRFKNNRQLPIALYDDVHFTSGTGLNERIQLSRVGVALPFATAIEDVGSANRVYA